MHLYYSLYFNRNVVYSIVLMAIVNASYRFNYIIIIQYHFAIVTDDASPFEPHIMNPFVFRNRNSPQTFFNYYYFYFLFIQFIKVT